MGGNLDKLKNNSKNPDNSPLLNKTLTNLKENFGSFKAICENFFIDLTEFEHIFGVSESCFVIWDTDKNGLIDSLELFAGLVVFSNSKFEDKIRFLFEIFDLNEVNTIGAVDVEFMIYSVLSSTYKIYEIKNEIDVEDISKFIQNSELIKIKSIKISNLINFAKQNNIIQEFILLIQRKNPDIQTDYQ